MEEQTLSTSKQAILDAAQALLARHGYAGLSMRELAIESGLAKATIYHYFQDKEEIFRQVLERDMLTVQEHLLRAIAAENGALAKLRAVVYTLFALMHARRTIIMSVLRELGENKQVFHEVICAHRDTHLRLLMGLIQAGIDEGVFRPVNVEYTTYSLLGMINTFVFFRLYLSDADVNNITIDAAAAEHTLQLILEGLQKPTPAMSSP
ncbi:MAG: TetR/AcrR family transcriptional regulator [Caldilinea sp. CFX5]|nr:TetR/AcrR family transcriptional regulator [Caldilinea sp. CFX5]